MGKLLKLPKKKQKQNQREKNGLCPPPPDTIYRDTPQNFSFVLLLWESPTPPDLFIINDLTVTSVLQKGNLAKILDKLR